MRNALLRTAVAFVVAATVLLASQPNAGFAQSGCTMVRLYPGYPGYRGVLEDSPGGGDVACLTDLERLDPSFDQTWQDAENSAAGRRIGATGDSADWTWETWMAVEAARKLPPHCHICVYIYGAPPLGPQRSGSRSEALASLGTYGGHDLAANYVNDNNLPAWMANKMPSDDQIRALAGMFNPDEFLGANAIIEFANSFFEAINTPGQFVNVEKAWCNAVEQGGYVPASKDMAEQDQLGLLLEAAWAISPYYNANAVQSVMQIMQDQFRTWESGAMSGQITDGFGTWFAQNGGRSVLASC